VGKIAHGRGRFGRLHPVVVDRDSMRNDWIVPGVTLYGALVRGCANWDKAYYPTKLETTASHALDQTRQRQERLHIELDWSHISAVLASNHKISYQERQYTL
jgi:hypothetical protein